MMKAADKKIYVGVDDGHYAVKVATESGACFSIPSRCKTGKHLISWDTRGDEGDGGIYTTVDEGLTFTAHSHLQDCDDTRFRDFPLSPLNRVLVHHALRRAGFGGKEVNIVTGLPMSYYYVGAQPNTALIDGKQENLAKQLTCESGVCAKIVSNGVTSEAIAAYFDQLINLDGTKSEVYDEFHNAHVGVIDVGGKTTDCAVILPGSSDVDPVRSGSGDVGILKLNDVVEAELRTKFGFDNVPTRVLESAISTGKIKVYGQEQDVRALVSRAKEVLAESILSQVRAKIGTGKDLDLILFVGGGSIVMRDQLASKFPHCRFPENPEFANSRGMLKIAKYIFGD